MRYGRFLRMKFSNYILKYLNESGGDETLIREIENILQIIKHLTNTKKFVTENMKCFAYKAGDIENNRPILNLWKGDTQTKSNLINALNKDSAAYEYFKQSSNEGYKIAGKDGKVIFTFRLTGKRIDNYWKEGVSKNSAEQTNYQEVGVLIWVSILKKGGQSLSDFDKKTKIYTDSDDTVEKSLKFLESESHKLNGWNTQCKNQAMGILKTIPQIKTTPYEYHQGGDLFKRIRKMGQKLSGIPGAADKWNPSDIYFIKKNFDKKLNSIKTIEELNSCLGNFDEAIGVSLKGSDAGHGAISLRNIFKFLKLKEPKYSEWNIKDGRLTPSQIKDYKKLLKSVQQAAKVCPFKNGVILYIGNNYKYKLSKNIDEMINHLQGTIESANWGVSIPVILSFLGELKTEELWNRFAFYAYSLAASQIDVSASYYKAEGTGTCKLIQSGGLDINKFECKVCRIPLSKETNIIFDAYYDNVSQKMQFRSKGGLPQMTIWHTEESVKQYFNISQFKI